MTLQQTLAFAVMAGAVVFFIWGKFRYDLVALSALLIGVVIGVIPAERMFSGFSNDLIWIVASVLILSSAIARSGLIEQLLQPVLKRLTKPALQVPVFAAAVMLLSMTMKNIGALAIMMPIAIQNARKTGTPVSQLLMPLAFASLLGGLVTLVGTVPNVVASSVRQTALGHPYHLFDFTLVGIGLCIAGFAFLAVGPLYIRINRPTPPTVAEALESARYVTELSLPESSEWIGKPFAELDAMSSDEVDVLSVASAGKAKPDPDRVFKLDDHILVEGEQAALEKFAASAKLTLTGSRHREDGEDPDAVRSVEGVISPDSPLVGRSVAQSGLHQKFGLSLLAIRRQGARITSELRSTRLRSGDVVIFKAAAQDMGDAFSALRVLPLSERTIALGARRAGLVPVALLFLAVLAIGMGWAPIHVAFGAAALGVLVLRIISMTDAYEAIEGPLLVLLGCLIPISDAIQRTGGAALLASPLSQMLAPLPPFLAIDLLLLIGMAVTPFLNSAATVLIVGPIAVSVAKTLGANPDAYLMAVAISAACDFLTPIGHQSNTLVMGPGGYRFGDYWRLGLPLSIIILAVAPPLVLLIWR